ncbi:hypothetical protein [Chromobacterium vaccinii]|uniref:hypothetical protein n=1 Tax=Chromobacterium vaccinii TaxID=1108595 RepID=UPI00069738BE|nr:hypothetical protein [Chromobacterium vaccinii]
MKPLTGLSGRAFLLMIVLAASSAWAASPTTANAGSRPAGVPQNYLITPFGYFHPFCVREVADGARLMDADAPPACASRAHFDAQGKAAAATGSATKAPRAANSLAAINGWVEDSELVGTSPYAGISASWQVPAAPANRGGQVVYFFPGLQDSNNVQSILQPVLGWNAFGDQAWTIASWNCCRDGAANYSTPRKVSSGDLIAGRVWHDCAAGAATCGSWNVETRDVTQNTLTTLSHTSNYGQSFNWAFGGVLEVYGVANCQNYPADGAISFRSIQLLDINEQVISSPVSLAWSANVLRQGGGCNYHAAASAAATALSY